MELVSVIVPVYKVEKYIHRCVNSLLNQTYPHLEIILVDDGSPDNCPQICDEYSANYKNIRVIHKENGGLSSARNAGIKACKGMYISFVDSDDFVDIRFIERLYNLIIKNKADVAMVKYEEVYSDEINEEPQYKKEQVYVGKDVERAFLRLKIDSVCVGLYLKDAVKNHLFVEGVTSEDIPFNFNVFRCISKFVYAPEKRYYYYYNIDSISNGKLDANMLNYVCFREEIYKYYSDGNDEEMKCLAEALYARAAFGLQTRMYLWGVDENINESDCKKYFSNIFKKHRKAFLKESSIPFSRKAISIIVFYFYWTSGIARVLVK